MSAIILHFDVESDVIDDLDTVSGKIEEHLMSLDIGTQIENLIEQQLLNVNVDVALTLEAVEIES